LDFKSRLGFVFGLLAYIEGAIEIWMREFARYEPADFLTFLLPFGEQPKNAKFFII